MNKGDGNSSERPGGGEMRSHFILFDDFETSDLACFIIPVNFFLQIPLGICPCFQGGLKHHC